VSKKLLIFLLTFLSFIPMLFAETKLPSPRSNEPIKVKSDQLITDNNLKIATFTGNVAARQGDITIYSDKMVISYSDEQGGISTAEVFGNVRIIQGERRALADHGIYNAESATIVLDGNPKVFQKSDTISGRIITYYLDQDKSEVTSDSGSRVEAVIQIKGKERNDKPSKP